MTDTPQEPTVAPDSLLDGSAPPVLDVSKGKPEGFPDDFWDAEKNTVKVDSLYDAFKNRDKIAKDLRVKLSRGEFEGKAPEDIKEYTLDLKEEIKGLIPEDDRLLARAREVAKEAGLPKEAFAKFMQPMIEEVIAMQQEATREPTPEELELAEEQAKLAKEEEIAKLGAGGKVMVQAVNGLIATLSAEGFFSEQDVVDARRMVYDAGTLRVMNKLRTRLQPSGVPINLPVTADSSKSDIEQKMVKAAFERNEAEYAKYAAMLANY